MDVEDDVKWRSVASTSRKILYYTNKITGQHKWTNKNCHCAKPKDPMQPTSPCCYKNQSTTHTSTEKRLTKRVNVGRNNRILSALSTKKLYSLSDIVKEVQKSSIVRRPKSYIYKGSRKRKRRKSPIYLDFKIKLIDTNDSRSDDSISKDSMNDANIAMDSVNDVNTAKDPNNDVIGTKDSNTDVTATKGPNNDVTVTKDRNTDVTGTKDPNTDVTGTKDRNTDVTAARGPNNDVTATKVPNVIKETRNDVFTPEDFKTDAIFNVQNQDPSKREEKVIPNKRILKRKREVSETVNGYKARLRCRRNKIEIACRRKYGRKNALKNAVSSQSAQVDSIDTCSPSKEDDLKLDNKELHQDRDLIEQSIIEIVECTSDQPIITHNTCCDFEAQRRRSEGFESHEAIPGKAEKARTEPGNTGKNLNDLLYAAVEVIEPRFVNEEFIQMNKPLPTLSKPSTKEIRKGKTIGTVEKKLAVSKRNYQQNSPTSVSPNSSSKIPVNAQSSRTLVLNRIELIPVTQSSFSLMSTTVSRVDSHLIPIKSKIVKPEQSNQRHWNEEGKTIANSPDILLSQEFANTSPTSPSSPRHNFRPSRNQSKRPLEKIVRCLKSKNKIAVPLTSTVSKMHWSTVLSKGAKKPVVENSSDIEKSNLSCYGSSLNPEQEGELRTPNDIRTASPLETKSSVFGQIKDTFSLCGRPAETPGKEKPPITLGNVEYTRKTKVSRGVGTNSPMRSSGCQTPELVKDVTEVPASYVDLSWRIVTSNDVGYSASLSNFFKLVPIVIARGPEGRVDKQESSSFLGVPIHGGPQVIAKILNTSEAQNCNEIFRVARKPTINTSGVYIKRMTLSFIWDGDAVLVKSESTNANGQSGKNILPRPPISIDLSNKVSIVLPKPLLLPQAGSNVYLGDFNVKVNSVEFVVSHSVVVTMSPRPSLTIPSGTPMNSTSSPCQTIRCRSPGETRNDVETAKAVAVTKKKPKEVSSIFTKCVFCGVVLLCQKDVKLHRRMHVSFQGTKCSECKRRFHNGGRLSIHIDKHKCHWLRICVKCKKAFRTPKFLTPEDLGKDYYKMCLSCRRKELKCKKCTERCMTFEELDVHSREKHGLKCPICQGCFLCKREISKHMKNQHEISTL